MGNNNNFMGNGSQLPENMPSPADAWQDMRARLDEEMPAGSAMPPPGGGIISIDNTLFRSVTLLFLLLLVSCPILLFTGKNAVGNRAATSAAVPNNSTPNYSPGDSNTQHNKPAITDTANKLPVNNNNNITGVTKPVRAGNANTLQAKNRHTQKQANYTQLAANGIDSSINNTNDVPAVNSGNRLLADTATILPANKQPVQAKNDNATGMAGADSIKAEAADGDKTQWQAGLWWKAQVPFNGAKHYADGPNGKSQPYRLLIPGVWIAMQDGKDMLDAELNVFATTVYRPQLFLGYLTIPNPNEPVSVYEEYKLTKTFGVSLAMGYSRHIGGNWWGGGNLQLTGLTAAANTIDSTISGINNTYYRSGGGRVKEGLWGDFNKLQVRLGGQLLYKTNHWQAGVRTGVHFMSPVSKYNTVHNPLETELFFRWGLWRWKK